MLKTLYPIEPTEAVDAVHALLDDLPGAEIHAVHYDQHLAVEHVADAVVRIAHGNVQRTIIVEVNTDGAPRFVRQAVYRLDSLLARLCLADAARGCPFPIAMLVCRYLPPDSRVICRDHGVAYLDLMGNARLAFDSVYIERAIPDRPKSETRSLRSVFSPKAAAILRALLCDPHKPWRVGDLADAANASLGHVSNVRKVLLDREWAEKQVNGIVIANPDALLKTWRESYRRPRGRQMTGYTHLHGDQLDKRLRGVLEPHRNRPRVVYSLLSAAQWFAPFGRDATRTFYADEIGSRRLAQRLDLAPAAKGANIVVRIPADETLFDDASEPVRDIFCTNPLATYLDLWCGNEREREAAEHLASRHISWLA